MELRRRRELSKALSLVENRAEGWRDLLTRCAPALRHVGVIGVTGPPGSGKSTLIDGLASHWSRSGDEVAVLAVDPSSAYSEGALLGDRIRMRQSQDQGAVFIRSLSARGHLGGLSESTIDLCAVLGHFGISRVLVETVGVGQNEVDVAFVSDCVVVLSVPGLGDRVQVDKAGLLEIGDVQVVAKSDLPGADAVRADIAQMLSMVFPGVPGANEIAAGGEGSAGRSAGARARFAAPPSGTGRPGEFWHPSVFAVSVSDQATIDHLAAGVDRFLDWSRASGLQSHRRLDRATTRLREILKQRLLAAMEADGKDRFAQAFQCLARAVAEEGLDPYTAVEHVLSATAAPLPNRTPESEHGPDKA